MSNFFKDELNNFAAKFGNRAMTRAMFDESMVGPEHGPRPVVPTPIHNPNYNQYEAMHGGMEPQFLNWKEISEASDRLEVWMESVVKNPTQKPTIRFGKVGYKPQSFNNFLQTKDKKKKVRK